jgi:hypothetical protein
VPKATGVRSTAHVWALPYCGVGGKIKVFLHAAAAPAEYAQAVRFIDHQQRAKSSTQLHDCGQIDDVAIHAELGVDHHEGVPISGLLQACSRAFGSPCP